MKDQSPVLNHRDDEISSQDECGYYSISACTDLVQIVGTIRIKTQEAGHPQVEIIELV